MLKSIKITNFQKHKELFIEFTKGVNTIFGTSDIGKSTIRRAIEWVAFNKSFKNLTTHGEKYTSVVVTLDDDTMIERFKSRSENYYKVNNEEPLKSFGRNVPEKISSLLNIDDINIQKQLDSAFLLSLRDGEKATYLDKILGTSEVTYCVKKSNKLLKEKLNEETLLKEEINDLKNKLDKQNELLKNKTKIKTIEILIKKIEESKHAIEEIKNTIKTLKINNKYLKHSKIINDIEILIETIKDLKELRKPLELFLKNNNILKESNKSIKIYNKIKESNIIEKIKINTEEKIDIEDCINNIRKNQKIIKNNNKFISEKETELMKFNNCPLCGEKLNGKNPYSTCL